MKISALKLAPMRLDEIVLLSQEENPEIVLIREEDRFFLNSRVADDFRIRRPVYELMKQAQTHLPQGVFFMVFEAYRPLSRQKLLWNIAREKILKDNPGISDDELQKVCENFVANPYDGIGSGHQACCAIDITLCDADRNELDMGTAMHEFSEKTRTDSELISPQQKKNRSILVNALEKTGIINYPAEWWHFSYGDHQWAWLTGKREALFGPIDI